jgi:hypothetical protein
MSALRVLVGTCFYAACFFTFSDGFHVDRFIHRPQNAFSPSGFSNTQRYDVGAFQQIPRTARSSSSALNLAADAAAAATTSNIFLNPDVWVFLAGVFPFAWATVEFWRRVMGGEAFGTGSDQVIIGMDDSPADSRGRRVLGRGALITAYVLFTIAFGTIGIVLYSVVSSGSAPDVLPEAYQTLVDTIVM